MATSLDTEVNKQIINRVSSDKLLEELKESGQLSANEIYFTPSNENSFSGLPVGAIFPSAIPIDDARVKLLNGSTIFQTGIYETFANLIKTLEASGQPITCTQTQFDEDIRLTGNCGKFVIDNDAGTIRLPKITTFIQGLSNITNIGLSLSAGLPNITGNFYSRAGSGYNGAIVGGDGAFSYTKDAGDDYSPLDTLTTGYQKSQTSFNANNGATTKGIYGNSETVQPNATQYPYYIVLASGYKSNQVVDVDNIMNEVNSKTTLLEAYPVGSIYMSTNSKSPASLFGGTWERLKDRFLLGAGDNYTEVYKDNGDGTYSGIGGSSTVTLTASQMPSHAHPGVYVNNTGLSCGVGSGNNGFLRLTSTTSSGSINSELHTGSAGGGQAHENMPPYATVYMWQRVEDDNDNIELY